MSAPICQAHPDCGRRAIRTLNGTPCCIYQPDETPPRLIARGAVGVTSPTGNRKGGMFG